MREARSEKQKSGKQTAEMKAYLTRPCELEKHARLCAAKGETPAPNGWLDQIHWLAAGDDDLFAFLWSAANFSHAWDDLVDECGWTPEMIEAAQARLAEMIEAHLRHQDTAPVTVNFLHVWHALIGSRTRDVADDCLANRAMSDFFLDLTRNPFVQAHRPEIETLLMLAMTRMLDGDAYARSADPAKRMLAPAVRCGDVDFYLGCVYLARGWTALRACSVWRQYDEPDQAEPVAANGDPVAVKHLTTMEAN
jgi:hypothetical protein